MSERKWKMVPVQPTEEMVAAAYAAETIAEDFYLADLNNLYKAMLAAAPEPTLEDEISILAAQVGVKFTPHKSESFDGGSDAD